MVLLEASPDNMDSLQGIMNGERYTLHVPLSGWTSHEDQFVSHDETKTEDYTDGTDTLLVTVSA